MQSIRIQPRANIISSVPAESRIRMRAFGREALICLAFLALTAVMAWPWVFHVRDHCSDAFSENLMPWYARTSASEDIIGACACAGG